MHKENNFITGSADQLAFDCLLVNSPEKSFTAVTANGAIVRVVN
jgi:hypothetical protein